MTIFRSTFASTTATCWARVAAGILFGLSCMPALALNPKRLITQYTHTVWTQEHGLPQDAIRAIAQTKDGYLWLGTDEGLARFDGFDFVVFNKENGAVPSNSIGALCGATDGSLWIGTPEGLTLYRGGKFTTYTSKDGLPDPSVSSIAEDRDGALWMTSGIYLSRLQNGKFTNYTPGKDLPIEAVRVVYVSQAGDTYAAGFEGVVRLEKGHFKLLIGRTNVSVVRAIVEDRDHNVWVTGVSGILMRTPTGKLRHFTTRDGLPDTFVRALWEDHDGNIWAGTNSGLARLEHDRFVATPSPTSRDRDWVRCIFEDYDGDLWVGTNSGLSRFRDDMFTNFGESEGLPSDEPTTVYQDHQRRIWIGFHDRGLLLFGEGSSTRYTTRDGLPSNEIFTVRETRNGDLLIATRLGPSRMHDGRFQNPVIDDPLNRHSAFDFMEDHLGRLWVAAPSGLHQIEGSRITNVLPEGRLLNDSVVVLCETRDGSVWAGSFASGLWRWKDGQSRRYTMADGLSSEQIRSLVEDADGALWIGTFGGGLSVLRNQRFFKVTAADGLLSDNISHIDDDGHGVLWLSTTRGISRLRKDDVLNFTAGKVRNVTPVNYGVADGLRSAQCAPGYPSSGGGTRSADGRLWFPTSRGLSMLDPNERPPALTPPAVHLLEMTVDGKPVPLATRAELPPGNGRVEFRYTGVNLSAPERVRYSYRLDGLEAEWVNSGSRRITNYSGLPHGNYQFIVRAALPGGPSSEAAFGFELLPHYYQTLWFRYLCVILTAAAIWGAFRLHVRQIRQRFDLVLEERTRLAREIHDTLAQGFVGISSQLDAVMLTLDTRLDIARTHLQLARKMVRHSLTEARRSVMDLRASALEGQDLTAALVEAAEHWTAGSPVRVRVDVAGERRGLPEELEQQLLRIAQEAVTNSVKHSNAKLVRIRLVWEDRKIVMQVADDGQGFEGTDALWEAGGHFGLLGMRERAQRLGGQLDLHSKPGEGTDVEVRVPLA